MSIVSDTLALYLPGKRKTTPSGWTSFNAPCCVHNNENAAPRGRGGVIYEGDNVSYHCFNCGFKASWQPGRNLSYKFKKLLEWMNAPDADITKLALDVMRENEGIEVQKHSVELPEFATTQLPEGSKPLSEWADYYALEPGGVDKNLWRIFEYMKERNLYLDDTDYHWSPTLDYRHRLILPFRYAGRIVGYKARTGGDTKANNLNDCQHVYALELNKQG